MDKTWIKNTSWRNEEYLQGNIRGVVVTFQGLNNRYREYAEPLDMALGERGVLVVSPYYGPWSWMNRNARAFVDELVAAVYQCYGLNVDVPLVVSGGSMGGCAALLYCRYGVRKPAGCDAFSPVCDVVAHFSERPDLPPSFYYAFYGYPEPMDAVLKEHSPLHQAELMPDIPYLFQHGTADDRVNKAVHSDRMVAALRRLGRQVEYVEVPGMKHGLNVPLSAYERRLEFITRCLER